jgi:pimeloyl-ACP methyl ester carboxylesterase
VGCSIGGRSIIDFALEHPELVRALVPVGSALSGFDAGEDPPEQWEELVAAENAGDLEPPAVNRLAEIQVPTLVIAGDLDRPEIIAAAHLLE